MWPTYFEGHKWNHRQRSEIDAFGKKLALQVYLQVDSLLEFLNCRVQSSSLDGETFCIIEDIETIDA
jgi:hypothetical protein